MSTMVLGLFATHAEAERAVDALAASGFGPDRIGFLGPGEVRERDRARSHLFGAGIGAVIGGVVGGLLGALVAAVTPGIGQVATVGALLPIAVGILVGGGIGAILGSLLTAAAAGSSDRIGYFVQEVGAGRSLVGVETDRIGHARALLLEAGAMEAAEVEGVDLPGPGGAR